MSHSSSSTDAERRSRLFGSQPGRRPQSIFAQLLLTLALLSISCGSGEDQPRVKIGKNSFEVEVAHTPEERQQGLADRPGLAPATGMLFVTDTGLAPTIWMKGMLFPLDFVWIGSDCTVVDTLINAPVPEPEAADPDLPTYGPGEPAEYVLELNALDVQRFRINTGDKVRFSDIDTEGADC